MAGHLPSIDLASGSSLLVAEIGEPSNNNLRIVVVEAQASEVEVETEVGPAHAIGPVAASRSFELFWRNYVIYAVRNESYCSLAPGEEPEGHFGSRLVSPFLGFAKTVTFASDDFPGPLHHWFLNTEWQCIDVVTNTPPEIRELTGHEAEAAVGNAARIAGDGNRVFAR